MKRLLLILAVIAGFLSCNNESGDMMSQNEPTEGVINFIYKGNPYYSSYVFNKDNSITLLNEDANEVYQKLQELPELATVVDGDVVKFFDNEAEFLKTIKIVEGNLTKAIGADCRWSIKAYTSVEYKGVMEPHSGISTAPYICYKVSYDNNWGSMVLYRESPAFTYACLFTFHEDGNCQGRSFGVLLNNGEAQQTSYIYDLSIIQRASFGRDWDNKISSFRVDWIVN